MKKLSFPVIVAALLLVLGSSGSARAVNYEAFMAADYNVHYADPAVTDHGAAGTKSVKTLVEAIGITEKATIRFPRLNSGTTTPYVFETSLDLSSYTNIQFVIENGAEIVPSVGVLVSFPRDSVTLAPHQRGFSGAGDISLGGTIYPEWFGAVADANGTIVGATDNSTAFAKAIKALWRGGGGEFVLNGTGTYRDNATWTGGAYYTSTPLMLVDTQTASGLPDGTTCTAVGDIKPITFRGQGSSKSIVVTDTIDNFFYFDGTSYSIHGKYHWRDWALIGLDTTSSVGMYWYSSMIRGNSIENMYMGGFYDTVIIQGSYNNQGDNLIIGMPTNKGLSLRGSQNMTFNGLQVRNGGNVGIDVYNSAAITFNNSQSAYHLNSAVQIRGSSDNVAFRELYIEPGAGEALDKDIIVINPVDEAGVGRLINVIEISNLRLNTGRFQTVSTAANVNVFSITGTGLTSGTAALEGLKIDGILIPAIKTYATGNVYVINNDAAARVTIASAEYKRQSVASAAAAYTSIFDSTTTEQEFNLIQDDQKPYTRIKTLLSYPLGFYKVDIADNTANQAMYTDHAADIIGMSYRVRQPWSCSLVGIAWEGGADLGDHLTVHDAVSGMSYVITSSTGTKRWSPGTYTIASNGYFAPQLDAAGIGAATRDIAIQFFFTINIDDQDNDS